MEREGDHKEVQEQLVGSNLRTLQDFLCKILPKQVDSPSLNQIAQPHLRTTNGPFALFSSGNGPSWNMLDARHLGRTPSLELAMIWYIVEGK